MVIMYDEFSYRSLFISTRLCEELLCLTDKTYPHQTTPHRSNGKMNGEGTMVWFEKRDGAYFAARYEGEWKDGKRVSKFVQIPKAQNRFSPKAAALAKEMDKNCDGPFLSNKNRTFLIGFKMIVKIVLFPCVVIVQILFVAMFKAIKNE
eukprot:TRINITY_DN4765_c0_g1_i2.p1 TRINITY_DN4765_c0_g1~~TRINITY_DN4765_c0_g1_i2.p1  ORF type:complete len:149 (+),score=8.56 TRINITY_DN4765_c0_g1_i2:159-605(+)